MKINPLFLHLGGHLKEDNLTIFKFSHQLVDHLNILLSDTDRQFNLISVDYADIPQPETQPEELPDLCEVHIYFFDNSLRSTMSGTLTVNGSGDTLLLIPTKKLWIVNSPDFNLEIYSNLLTTIIHEFEHSRGKRGEGYMIKNADPPPEIPMPRLNSWNYPNDIYWDSGKVGMMKDPFYTTRLFGHPLFMDEEQDLEWMLKNIRPCKGNSEIIKGNYRKGAPWSKTIKLNVIHNNTSISNAKVRTWSIPQYYQDPWISETDSTTGENGDIYLTWNNQEHNNPLMAIRIDYDDLVCAGYISIFELEWLAVEELESEALADLSTGRITIPSLTWMNAPNLMPIEYPKEDILVNSSISGQSYIVYPTIKPWELTKKWRPGMTIWQQMKVIIDWVRSQNR